MVILITLSVGKLDLGGKGVLQLENGQFEQGLNLQLIQNLNC